MRVAQSAFLCPSDTPPPDLIAFDASTAKNAILPLLVASLLNQDRTRFKISDGFSLIDAEAIIELLRSSGAIVTNSAEHIEVDASSVHYVELPQAIVARTRYSLLLLGAMLSRFGRASVHPPGGCDLGRPYDYHVEVLKSLGCSVIAAEDGSIQAKRARHALPVIALPYPSVGATINAVLCASTSHPAEGETITLHNCANEPEIDDVLSFLRKLGLEIERRWRTIVIVPRPILQSKPLLHSPIRDRIEAGSYALAAAILGVKAIIRNAPVALMDSVLTLLIRLDCQVSNHGRALVIDGRRIDRSIGLNVVTEPYPGFPTDLHPILTVLCAGQHVISSINDTVMPKRTQYLRALRSLGANVEAHGSVITIAPLARHRHVDGEPISIVASDLRGGMAAVLFALRIGSKCRIENFNQVRRGYSQIDDVVEAMGGVLSQC